MRTFRTAACATLAVLASAAPAAGQDADVVRAFAAVRARADAGDVVAQFSLGAMIYYGQEDTAQAIDWIRRAAAQGYAPAEFHIGQLYDFGFGVVQDPREAFTWYKRAAEHGSAAGQRAVGDCYQKGRGVNADAAEAARWYRRAADGDDIRAQHALGQMYFSGHGVAQDYVQAYVWFTLAAGQAPLLDNRQGLLELRNIAAARMTPAEVAAATRRVAAWKPAPAPAK